MLKRFICFILTLPAASMLLGQDLPRFQARTDLVFLTVTVTDRNGKPVDGLKRTDFRVYEDRLEQQVQYFDRSSAAVSIGLVLDRSGSMSHMIDEVYQAALHVAESMGPRDELFALTFNNQVELAQGPTGDKGRIRRALRGLTAFGGTALYDAVYQGIRLLNKSSAVRKVLCVVSDGADTVSRTGFDELLKLAEESQVLIYPVGMVEDIPLVNWGPFGNRYVKHLKQLAQSTGGRAHFPRNLEECRRKMEEIAQELHAQYGLGYYPSRPLSEGGWREIKIALKKEHKKLRLRCRTGYQATAQFP